MLSWRHTHWKRVRTRQSFFASNQSQAESEKNGTEDEQCINKKEKARGSKETQKIMNFQKIWQRDHTWLCNEKEAMFCYFCWKSKDKPLCIDRRVSKVLEPQLHKDMQTVKNMRMLLMKKVWGICSATDSNIFLTR